MGMRQNNGSQNRDQLLFLRNNLLQENMSTGVNNVWKLQYSLQSAEAVGAKKLSANWGCPPFGKFYNIGLNFENKTFFYIYEVHLR